VYIYGVGGSSFAFQQKITAFDYDGNDNNVRDAFGFSLSIYDGTLASSAKYDDDSGDDSGQGLFETRINCICNHSVML
jgi:hypothetical protein